MEILFALALLCPTADEPAPIKALLVTGGSSHDYDAQKKIIKEGLESRIPIEITIEDGGRDRAKPHPVYEKGWTEGYDLIIHNECFGGVVDDSFIEGIVDAHMKGVPGVFIHCSMHSYRNAGSGAEAWRELVGVKSMRHQQKDRLLAIPDAEHPTLQGFPNAWHTPQGELYLIEKIYPNTTVLATAYSTKTKTDHPVIWTNKLGKTRVFATSLGHHNETMDTEEWMGLVSRGCMWATGRLDETK